MTARTRPPRLLAAIAAYVALFVIVAIGWGVVLLLWQLMRLAMAYPDLALLTAAALMVAYATRESWRQARYRESLDTESTRNEW